MNPNLNKPKSITFAAGQVSAAETEACPPREGSLLANIRRLQDAVSEQLQIIHELHKQLEPVLVMSPEVNAKDSPTPSPGQTPNMVELHSASQDVYRNTALIQDIINRLQIR